MGDYYIDWNDSQFSFDESSNHSIPIPRSQQNQILRSDLEYSMNAQDSPCRPPLVPPNSLVGNNLSNCNNYPFEINYEPQRPTFSPLDGVSPLPSNVDGMEYMEIKMEPHDSLLDITDMINSSNDPIYQEDNLLDNVNFEDLLMTDDMDSSTTCLDPQHSSPAVMATVHPDEVLGMTRTESKQLSQTFTPSISVPMKPDHFPLGAFGASSLPPQGIGWKDSLFNLPTSHSGFLPNSFKEISNAESRISNLDYNLSHVKTEPNNLNEASLYAINDQPINSTLQNLLLSSPSPTLSSSPQVMSPKEENIMIGQSVPGGSSFFNSRAPQFVTSRLSCSAPSNESSFEQYWQRRGEPRSHLLSSGSLAEETGGSTSSLSTGGGGILSPIPHDPSIDEEIDSEDDSDGEHYDSDSDDNDSIMSEETSSLNPNGKKERHFWQYNVQAKGPKGQRVNIIQKETNPRRLTEIMDPVFSPLCSVQGIKHSGKARRGDGNDLTASPGKLVSIGAELDKLNQKINDMTPVSELPSTVRSKSRKEKNKLASRACRLKKKAQHEANKIKLNGLDKEHQGLLAMIKKVREDLLKKVEINQTGDISFNVLPMDDTQAQLQKELTHSIEITAKMAKEHRIAGFTTEFINRVIENCRSGNSKGGIEELTRVFTNTRNNSLTDLRQSKQEEMLFS